MRARGKTHGWSWWRLASAGHKSLGLGLIFWQNLIGHGDDVWRACVDCCACCWFGTVASLWLACLQLDYLPCLATWKLDFFLAKPCRTWWRSASPDVSDMKKLCMEVSVVVLEVPFTWDFIFTVVHMEHAHTPLFRNLALAIGFSSESVLKYERLKHKKRNLSAWWLKCFFIIIIIIERQFFS